MLESEEIKFVSDSSVTAETLYNNGVLTRSAEEAQVLCMYRKLCQVSKISITSRIEGMLEAQTYAKPLDE